MSSRSQHSSARNPNTTKKNTHQPRKLRRRYSSFLTEAFMPMTPGPSDRKSTPSKPVPFMMPKHMQETRFARMRKFVKSVFPRKKLDKQKASVTLDDLGEQMMDLVISEDTTQIKKQVVKLKKDKKNKGQAAVIVLAPAPASEPGFTRKGIFGPNDKSKAEKINPSHHVRHDSGFSSNVSLPSTYQVATNPNPTPSIAFNPTLTLTTAEYARLQSYLRRTRRSLAKQEHITHNLHNNMYTLLRKMERHISTFPHARYIARADREIMRRVLFLVRENAGRLFRRMALMLGHSQSLLSELTGMLSGKNAVMLPGAHGDIVGIKSDMKMVMELVRGIDLDLGAQRALSDGLIGLVGWYARDERTLRAFGNFLLVQRFVGFVEARVEVLGASIERTGGFVAQFGTLRRVPTGGGRRRSVIVAA